MTITFFQPPNNSNTPNPMGPFMRGASGLAAPANSLSITAVSIAAGAAPTAVLSGIAPNQVLVLGIPAGAAGATGATGATTTSLNSSAINYSNPNTGALIPVENIIRSHLTVRQFGAYPGQTDSRSDLQSAITYAQNNGKNLYCESGIFNVGSDGSGTCLRLDGSCSFIGEIGRTVFTPIASQVLDADIFFNITPAQNRFVDGMLFEGFTVGDISNGSRKGYYGIFVDTYSPSYNAQISRMKIKDNFIVGGSGGVPALYLYNHPSHEGIYTAEISGNIFQGGINTGNLGDSCTFANNTLSPNANNQSLPGISLQNRFGASKCTIRDNNITTRGGAIIIHSGSRCSIYDNNIEKLSVGQGSSVNDAVIDIAADVSTVWGVYIGRNLIGGYNGPLAGGCIFVSNNASGTLIEHNNIFPTGVTKGIINNISSTIIRPNGFDSNVNPANWILDNAACYNEGHHYTVGAS